MSFVFSMLGLSIFGALFALRKAIVHVFKRIRDSSQNNVYAWMEGTLEVAKLANSFFLALKENRVSGYEKKEFDTCLYLRAKNQLKITKGELKAYKHYSGLISSFLSHVSKCEKQKHTIYLELKKELQCLNRNITTYENEKFSTKTSQPSLKQ